MNLQFTTSVTLGGFILTDEYLPGLLLGGYDPAVYHPVLLLGGCILSYDFLRVLLRGGYVPSVYHPVLLRGVRILPDNYHSRTCILPPHVTPGWMYTMR